MAAVRTTDGSAGRYPASTSSTDTSWHVSLAEQYGHPSSQLHQSTMSISDTCQIRKLLRLSATW
jgi:hypothetical protein